MTTTTLDLTMSETPDTHELGRRLHTIEELFDELRKVVSSLLAWRDKMAGGISVMCWVVGVVQSIVLLCLGFAANSLNNTATILGQHAVELATSRAKIEAYILHSADRDAIAEAKMREWVREELRKPK
jgi:hypothetical protein